MTLPLKDPWARMARAGELVPVVAVYPVRDGRHSYWVGIAELNVRDLNQCNEPQVIQYSVCLTRLGAWLAVAWALWRSGAIVPDLLEEEAP